MYHKILVATDLSESAEQVVKKAHQLAQKLAAEVHVIHVIEPLAVYGYVGIAELEMTLLTLAREQVAKFCSSLGIPGTHQHVEFGSVKGEVLRLAESKKIDLIVVGSHSRKGIARFLGSSAHGVLNHAMCDVLTVHCEH